MYKYEELFCRNIGFINKQEQQKLSRFSIGIAGMGADGGLLAERLVRFGIGKIVLADPEVFEPSNVNRQFAANIRNIKKNKAEVIAKELILINPRLEVVVFNKGVNRTNVGNFVREAEIIVDEIEYLNHELSVLLARETRKQYKYLFMGANIGWGGSILCFSPKEMSFEKYFQYDPLTKKINLLRYVKKIPEYFDRRLIQKIIKREIIIPSLASSVGLVTSLLSSEIILFILGKKRPISVPRILFFDAFERKIKIR